MTPEGGVVSIGLMKAEGVGKLRTHDRYSPGLHHVAWSADSREELPRLWRGLLRSVLQ